MFKRLRSSILLTLLLLLPACAKNPATGDRFFSTLSRDDEIALGVEAKPQMTKEFGGQISNTQLQNYLTNLGKKLATFTEADNPSLPWEFTLLDSSVINAFALPGGKVFVSRGLIEKMTNEAQLAGVVGHEIGHVTAQHTARRMGQATLFQGGIGLAGAITGAAAEGTTLRQTGDLLLPAVNVGGQMVLLKFSRDEESQADSLGLRYMTRAGYNPTAQLQVMEILKQASSGGKDPEFMSTHPHPETRITRLRDELKKSYATVTPRTDNYFEDRFQRECLAILKKLPRPTKKAEAEARAVMEMARAANSAAGHQCTDSCNHGG